MFPQATEVTKDLLCDYVINLLESLYFARNRRERDSTLVLWRAETELGMGVLTPGEDGSSVRASKRVRVRAGDLQNFHALNLHQFQI